MAKDGEGVANGSGVDPQLPMPPSLEMLAANCRSIYKRWDNYLWIIILTVIPGRVICDDGLIENRALVICRISRTAMIGPGGHESHP